jgi:pyruvate formate lyase activating enzyme
MLIAGYLKTSLLDWPGKISGVIWTVGCNFRCPFCHNSGLIVYRKGMDLIDEKDVLTDLEKRKQWIDGLVITGGEPTLQADLEGFVGKIRRLGFGVKLDTNGTSPSVLDHLFRRRLVDFVAMDVKTQWHLYSSLMGFTVNTHPVQDSLGAIFRSGVDYELRTTVVPGIHNEEILLGLARQLSATAREQRRKIDKINWVWQNFVGRNSLNPEFNGKKGYPPGKIQKLKKTVEKTGIRVRLRGW